MPTTSSSQASNPYRPPATVASEFDLSAQTEVSFHLNPRLRRYATNQYLLHLHGGRLLFGSLLMILVSSVCVAASVEFGDTAFYLTFLFVMLGSAAIYKALVYRTKRRIHRRLSEFGLADDNLVTLQGELDQVRLLSPDGSHTWPNDQIKLHQTNRGLLICPEPLLFIFIPKKGHLHAESYRQFVKILRSRTSAEKENRTT